MAKVTKTLFVALAAAAVAVPVAQGGSMRPNPWKDTGVTRPNPFKDTGLTKPHPFKDTGVARHLNRGVNRMNPWKDPKPLLSLEHAEG